MPFFGWWFLVGMPPLPVVEPEVKMSSVEIQAVFPLVATAEEPPKKRRRSSGSATGKGTDYTYTKKQVLKEFKFVFILLM